ncbi:MAG: BTAD domain-containing putative transcriptional regulator [Oscillospiraceae bacterium]
MDKKVVAPLKISMLGGFDARIGAEVLTDKLPRTSHVWTLLKYLAAHPNIPLSTESIIEILWEDNEVKNPISALYNLAYRLRKILAEPYGGDAVFITFSQNCYMWNPDCPVELDTSKFAELCSHADTEKNASLAAKKYIRAFRMYKGEFLKGTDSESWIMPIAAHYRGLFDRCAYKICDHFRTQSNYLRVADICEYAIQFDPYEEGLHEILLDALMRLNKRAKALEYFDYISKKLFFDLGIDVSPKMRQLVSSPHSVQSLSGREAVSELLVGSGADTADDNTLFCELYVFRRIYQLLLRTFKRSGEDSALLSLRLEKSGEADVPAKDLQNAASFLHKLILSTFRRCDIATTLANDQMLVLMPNTDVRGCLYAFKRLEQTFSKKYMRKNIICVSDIRGISQIVSEKVKP